MVKRCPKCSTIKDLTEFNTNRSRNDGVSDWCRICNRKQNKEHKEKNKERINLKNRIYEQKNKEKISKRRKISYQKNKEQKLEYQRQYRRKNKELVNYKKRAYRKVYEKVRLRTDAVYRLHCNLRARLRNGLKKIYKKGKTSDLIGCSFKELQTYIENQFQPGMTWENWSPTGWHLDHIKPLAAFDITDHNEVLKACHYTNLQPLWAKDHIEKSKKDIKIILDFKNKK